MEMEQDPPSKLWGHIINDFYSYTFNRIEQKRTPSLGVDGYDNEGGGKNL